MHSRCSNANSKHFANYGGRGIQVCERWRSFENFFADMGERPSGKTLERINNDGAYSPANCCWATRLEQQCNRRSSVRITIDGTTKTQTQWARLIGLRPHSLSSYRKRNGAIALQTHIAERVRCLISTERRTSP